MLNKKIAALVSLLILPLCLLAQEEKQTLSRKEQKKAELREKYPDSYLDTIKMEKVFVLNDYVSVNFERGVSYNQMRFNPAYLQKTLSSPEYYELSFTKNCTFLGYMPYFALKGGISYGHEGYSFKMNKEKGTISMLEGATDCRYNVLDMAVYSQFHVDVPYFKAFLEAGPYMGYRLDIERIGPKVSPETQFSFLSTDRRFDYGLKGGAGFAFVFSPVEFFINAKLRFSWQNLFDPDYASPYYYRYAYPMDLIISGGVSFQLSRRTGKTNKMLKQEAKRLVYGE